METIIQQIAAELTEKLLKDVKKAGLNLNVVSELLLEDCKEAARRIIQACAQEVNEQLRSDKAFRKGHLAVKEKNRPRRILTAVGEVPLERDYYYDQEKGCYATPLDEVLGIQPYERLLPSIGAELVTQATECSYARSAQLVTGGAVSRQTVRNQILKLHVPEKEPERQRKTVKELHIFADEDHVHMQKPGKEKGKKNQIVPLVTVTEGIEGEKGRRRTVNPMSFVDEASVGERLRVHRESIRHGRAGKNLYSRGRWKLDQERIGRVPPDSTRHGRVPFRERAEADSKSVSGEKREKADPRCDRERR